MATYYPITSGGNWSAAGTWNTSPNQATGNAPNAPLTTDYVELDEYGGAVVVNATNCVCKALTCSHANANLTITETKILQVSGNVTFIAGMTLSGTGLLQVSGDSTLTSGGLTFPAELTFLGANTKTLVGNWINTGLVKVSGATVLNLTTAETFTCNGGLTMSAAISGTATIILGGTGGTWSLAGNIANNLTINCTTLTLGTSLNWGADGATLTYTAGAITVTSSLLTITGSPTINTGGMSWNNLTATGTGKTWTLSSDLVYGGYLAVPNGTALTIAGAYDVTGGTFLFPAGNNTTSLTFPAGQTLTLTASLLAAGGFTTIGAAVTREIKSGTASSPFYLNYSGDADNCKVSGITFTDVDASGSAQGIDNWYGGTLTRCSGITNRTSADIGGGTRAWAYAG